MAATIVKISIRRADLFAQLCVYFFWLLGFCLNYYCHGLLLYSGRHTCGARGSYKSRFPCDENNGGLYNVD